MSHQIAILGSTGSIGTQTLEVAQAMGLRVVALAAGQNVDLLAEQIVRFHPQIASVAHPSGLSALRQALASHPDGAYTRPIELLCGEEGNEAVATCADADLVVAAMVGIAGLAPVLAAIRAGKHIALANKETLVAAGHLAIPLSRACHVRLLPVDSEHSAVWQCLMGNEEHPIRRILLTASGGPFRQSSAAELERVDVAAALAHPTWKMGGKITIDSATMMNKGLEVIEAAWLFDVPADRIQVVVHPQSIVHSMVEFQDRSVFAQLGFPDMRLPIQIALAWPQRFEGSCEPFDPFDPRAATLSFEPPDPIRFPCLRLAYEAARTGGSLPCVLNAANEEAVGAFLNGDLSFLMIPRLVEACMNRHAQEGVVPHPSFDDIMDLDQWARGFTRTFRR